MRPEAKLGRDEAGDLAVGGISRSGTWLCVGVFGDDSRDVGT